MKNELSAAAPKQIEGNGNGNGATEQDAATAEQQAGDTA
jgi:hypothetical protein